MDSKSLSKILVEFMSKHMGHDGLEGIVSVKTFEDSNISMFSRIIYLRSKNNKGKLTKEEKQECNRIGWDIIRMTSEEELKQRQDDKAFFEERMKKFDKR